MNCIAELSKIGSSSSPIVVTDVMVLREATGDPPFSEACVDCYDSSKLSNLKDFMSLKVCCSCSSLSLFK